MLMALNDHYRTQTNSNKRTKLRRSNRFLLITINITMLNKLSNEKDKFVK